jgi:hypothetical protein
MTPRPKSATRKASGISGMSPAMGVRLETRLWDIADIVKLIEE